MSKEVLEAKKQKVQEIKAKIENASSLVLVDYKGLTVKQDTELRAKFRESGVEYKVMKNRLVKIAFNELGYDQFDDALQGPTAIAFGSDDSIAPCRVTFQGTKAFNGLPKAKCGLFEGKFIDLDTVQALAALPPKDVLLSKMLGSMLAPISKLAYVLKAIADKQDEAKAE